MRYFTLAPSPLGGFAFLPTTVPYPWLLYPDRYFFDWPIEIPDNLRVFPDGYRPLLCDGFFMQETPGQDDLVLMPSWDVYSNPPLSYFSRYAWRAYCPDAHYTARFVRKIKDP